MAEREPFISRVRLKNYKSIAECDVRLSPLTILIGPNGSGKSNFLDALAFLARALETTPYEAINERGGLGEILCRVPERAGAFSVEVGVAVPWGFPPEEAVVGSYGFEIGPARRRGSRPFEVVWESCSPPSGQRAMSWRADYGNVHAEPSNSPVAGVEPDRLYLPVAGAQLAIGPSFSAAPARSIPSPFSPLLRALSSMRFYNFGLDELRRPQPQSPGASLGRHGEHLADVLQSLEEQYTSHKQRLDAYLRAVLPGVTGIDSWFAEESPGRYMTVKLRFPTGPEGSDIGFAPNAMSDGTIRAAAVLAALFQPAVLSGHIPLIGIEEPEIALHPAAGSVLFDVLTEASERTQVVVTSQSPDLLDRDELDVSVVRAVTMEHGLTIIGEIDPASRRIVRDKLYTLGELMRGSQLIPAQAPNGGTAGQEA